MELNKCFRCGSTNSMIIDSNKVREPEYGFVRRKRECQSCGQRWTVMETDKATVKRLKEFIEGSTK